MRHRSAVLGHRALLLGRGADRGDRLGAHALGKEPRDLLAHGVLRDRAEHALGGAVDHRHHAAFVEHDDRVHRRADDLAEARLGLHELAHVAQLELLPLDVAQLLLLLGDAPLLEIQVDEHLHLGAQDRRLERLEHVVDRANRIPLKDVLVVLADRGEEDDRDVLRALAGLDRLRRLEAVDARHLHVEKDDGEILIEQAAKRIGAGRRPHETLSERLENGLEREKILPAVVDEEDVDRLRRRRSSSGSRPLGSARS